MIRVIITLPSSDNDLLAEKIVELQMEVNERHDPKAEIMVLNEYVKIESYEEI